MASPDAGAGPVRSPVVLRVLGVAFLAWSVVGLVALSQMWVEAMSHRGPPLEWRPVGRMFEDIWAWAAYTPLILWLAERLPLDRERWRSRLPAHAAIALGFTGVDALLDSLLAPVLGPFPAPGLAASFARHATAAVLSYFAVLGIGHAVRYHRLHVEGRLHASELERQLAQARLGALEAQLRPHFLFNALHAVASLVRAGDQKAAIRTIAGLGEILRAALRDGEEQEIPLAEELRLAERYLDIERARFEDRLAVRIEADAGLGDGLVPRFVLQPLLENAVRHGIAPRPAGGAITVRVMRAEAMLVVEVVDSGAGRAQPRAHGTGVGLANTRARLRHLYGPAASLALDASADGATARIVVPYRPAPARQIA